MKRLGLCLLVLIGRVLNDLPIHCLNSQITGIWRFQFSKGNRLISGIENSCGHDMPDSENTSLLAMKDSQMDNGQFTIELFEDGSVDDINAIRKKNNNKGIIDIFQNGQQQSQSRFRFKTNYEKKKKENNSNRKDKNGNGWTMIYDEGFELKIEGIKVLVFNQYFKQNGKWKSNCSNTLVGWYRNEMDNTYGCIRGSMVNKDSQINDQQAGLLVVQNRVEQKQKRFRYFRFKESYKKYTLKIKKTFNRNRKFNFRMDDRFKNKLQLNSKFIAHQKVVDKLNSIKGKTWTAGVNKYFLTKTIGEINRMSGRMKKNNKVKQNQNISQSYVNEDISIFPKEWDWTKKLNYQPKIRSQEDCGSCYVISTMSMIDFRLKIKYPDSDIDRMSIQFPIDCSFYNQGCDGGYPSLVAKFGHDVFLLEEKYKSYQGKNGVCKQFDSSLSKVQRIVKIGDYGYVGGRYGNSNTSNIMREIMNNGPVVLSFEPDYFFSLYTKGVYQKLEPSEWIDKGILRPEWIKIDHSVLCYGWGETDDGIKYWILQNSWGDTWGQDGTFLMLRQKDEMGIESSAEFADPYIDDLSKLRPQLNLLQKQ